MSAGEPLRAWTHRLARALEHAGFPYAIVASAAWPHSGSLKKKAALRRAAFDCLDEGLASGR